MGSDAISNAHVNAFAKDSSKKKRGDKMAKLKQIKLNFGREQCLIEVTSKEYIVNANDIGATNFPSIPKGIAQHQKRRNPEILPIHGSEAISWMSSSISGNSDHSILRNGFHRRRSISSSSGSCSSSCSEEDGGKGCLDDWETLTVGKRNQSNLFMSQDCSQSIGKGRAWSPDDVFRPRSLPRISMQQNNLTHISVNDVSGNRMVCPSVCPICCEDLDVTDSSFLPCPCGFRLCLFCHKKIIEVDGRCPGCRKRYGSENACAGNPGASLALPMR